MVLQEERHQSDHQLSHPCLYNIATNGVFSLCFASNEYLCRRCLLVSDVIEVQVSTLASRVGANLHGIIR